MRKCWLCFGAILLTSGLFAQTIFDRPGGRRQAPAEEDPENRGFKRENLVFGGAMGLQFGDFTFINMSPQVGYQFSDFFTAGAGINYIYSSIKTRNFQGNELFRENLGFAGANLFARLFPADFLFVSLQPEVNYRWGKIKFKDGSPTMNMPSATVPSFLVGAGISVGGSRTGRGTLISVQYDLAQDPRSPYGTRPFLNFGFAF